LLEAGRRGDRDASDVVAFMAGTGWRIGEAIALTAGAVEDNGDKVYVVMGRVHRRLVGFTEGGKSEAADGRRLRIVGPAVGVLRRRIVGRAPGDLVFTYQDARYTRNPMVRPWHPSSFRRRWIALAAEAGLSERVPTPHWLRHTHVALCHAAGMSLPEIQRRIGHEDIQTTINTYGRMIDEMNDQSAEKLDRLLTPKPVGEQVIEGVVLGEVTDS
jgi:integrase